MHHLWRAPAGSGRFLFNGSSAHTALAVILCLLTPAGAHARSSVSASPLPARPLRELRGLWVVRDSLTSRQAIENIVAAASRSNINALFVQVRGRGDALYSTPFEPRSEALAGAPAGFDPLREVITAAHSRGIQVHAWMNTFLTWSGYHAPRSEAHLWNAHRDWFACSAAGKCTAVPTNTCEGAFLQPGSPEVQAHLCNVFSHVARNYDVDGIHFDYCRYAGKDYDFSAGALARFRANLAATLQPAELEALDQKCRTDRLAYVHAHGGQWETWRRSQLSATIARIVMSIREARPSIVVSAAVFADANEALKVRGQDWQMWVRTGVLDAVALMAYGQQTERVLAQTRQAISLVGADHVITGIGAWRLNAHDVAQKIAGVRRAGAAGVNLFSYGGVHNRPNYLSTLARGVFASRATPPNFRAWAQEPARPSDARR